MLTSPINSRILFTLILAPHSAQIARDDNGPVQFPKIPTVPKDLKPAYSKYELSHSNPGEKKKLDFFFFSFYLTHLVSISLFVLLVCFCLFVVVQGCLVHR